MKKIATVGLCIATPLVVVILGAILADYVFKIGVLGTGRFVYFLIAGVIAGIIVFLATRKISFSICTAIGFLLIPYVAFLIGQMDFYVADDSLAQGVTVSEVRPTIDNITFGTTSGQDVSVWSGPETLKLHPGENRVKLGRFNMPAGTYEGGKIYISGIQVDIQADFSKIPDPVSGQVIAPEYYSDAFDTMKGLMTLSSGGADTNLINSSLNGSVGTFTIAVSGMTQPISLPQINYPGFGGPDITLDIKLDDEGRPDPSQIRAIVEVPPGMAGIFPQIPGVEYK